MPWRARGQEVGKIASKRPTSPTPPSTLWLRKIDGAVPTGHSEIKGMDLAADSPPQSGLREMLTADK